MNNKNKSNIDQRKNPKPYFFDFITNIFANIQIVASPLMLGAVIGFVIYCAHPTAPALFIALCLVIIGLITGIIWAISISKKRSATEFMSKIKASSELNKSEN